MEKINNENGLTCARLDCLPESFRVGKCEENCDTSTDLLLVTDLANLANLLNPMAETTHRKLDKQACVVLFFNQKRKVGKITSFVFVLLDGLLEGGDVPEGEQEEDHQVSLVFDWCYLQEQP